MPTGRKVIGDLGCSQAQTLVVNDVEVRAVPRCDDAPIEETDCLSRVSTLSLDQVCDRQLRTSRAIARRPRLLPKRFDETNY